MISSIIRERLILKSKTFRRISHLVSRILHMRWIMTDVGVVMKKTKKKLISYRFRKEDGSFPCFGLELFLNGNHIWTHMI